MGVGVLRTLNPSPRVHDYQHHATFFSFDFSFSAIKPQATFTFFFVSLVRSTGKGPTVVEPKLFSLLSVENKQKNQRSLWRKLVKQRVLAQVQLDEYYRGWRSYQV
jgi:hypothetical protein